MSLDQLVARKRKQREQALSGLHLKLPIPGAEWDGDLVARYEVRDYGGSFEHDADLLARVCARLYLRDETWDGKLVSLLDDAGEPIGFDSRLTAKFGRPEITTARDVVRYVFGEGNDTELSDHAVGVFAWLRDTSRFIPGNVTAERADHEPEAEPEESDPPTPAPGDAPPDDGPQSNPKD